MVDTNTTCEAVSAALGWMLTLIQTGRVVVTPYAFLGLHTSPGALHTPSKHRNTSTSTCIHTITNTSKNRVFTYETCTLTNILTGLETHKYNKKKHTYKKVRGKAGGYKRVKEKGTRDFLNIRRESASQEHVRHRRPTPSLPSTE